jgi:hypothetical protein
VEKRKIAPGGTRAMVSSLYQLNYPYSKSLLNVFVAEIEMSFMEHPVTRSLALIVHG